MGQTPAGRNCQICQGSLLTCSGPLSNIFLVLGNWWEWGVYCTATVLTLGRAASSRLTGCLGTSLVRLELLVLVVGGDPLRDRTQGQGLGIAGHEVCVCIVFFHSAPF